MKVEVAVLGSTSLIVLIVSVDVKQQNRLPRAQELCESRGGRPGFLGSLSLIILMVSVDRKSP